MNNKGFTLAEVLVTLGVIGIIAVITLPGLIQKHNEKTAAAKLKKFYSQINQSFEKAVFEYGPPDTWGYSATEFDEDGRYTEKSDENLNQIWNILLKDFKIIEKHSLSDNSNKHGTIYLADGIFIHMGWWGVPSCSTSWYTRTDSKYLKHVCGDFTVSINGTKQKQIYGKDIFRFYITKYGIFPFGADGDDKYPFKTYCKQVSDVERNGWGCTAWVIFNGNMDYLHCDGLDWNVKTKCGKTR